IDEQRQPSGIPSRGRERAARGAQLRALLVPSRREIRGLEGCHRRFRSARHVPRLIRIAKRVGTPDPMSYRFTFTRRRLLALGAAASGAMLVLPATAQTRLDVTQG